jgi:hypothetical protein
MIPPSGPGATKRFEKLAVPASYRPRGATAATRTPRSEFDRHDAPTPCSHSRQPPSRCRCCQAAITARSARRNL